MPDDVTPPDAPVDAGPATPEAVETKSPLEVELAATRAEAAQRRHDLKPYKEAFDGYDPEAQQAWLELINLAKADPDQARQVLMDSFGLTAAQADAQVDDMTPAAPPDPAQAPVTRADLDAWWSEREAGLQLESAVTQLNRDAGALGYQEGTRDYIDLLYYMNEHTNGDLAKAHEMLQADNQARLEELIAAKDAQARGVPLPSASGQAPSLAAEPPKSWAEARTRAEERIDKAL